MNVIGTNSLSNILDSFTSLKQPKSIKTLSFVLYNKHVYSFSLFFLGHFCIRPYPVDQNKLGNTRAGVGHSTEAVHDFPAVEFLHHFFNSAIFHTSQINVQTYRQKTKYF